MPMYVADFSYDIQEWGSVTLEAEDGHQAEDSVMEHIREAYPDVKNIDIDSIKVL